MVEKRMMGKVVLMVVVAVVVVRSEKVCWSCQ